MLKHKRYISVSVNSIAASLGRHMKAIKQLYQQDMWTNFQWTSNYQYVHPDRSTSQIEILTSSIAFTSVELLIILILLSSHPSCVFIYIVLRFN
jgi:hypothetical protein